MNGYIIIALQLFGLISSWLGAFYLGAIICGVNRSPAYGPTTAERGRSTSTTSRSFGLLSIIDGTSSRNTGASIQNEICSSSVEDTERHQFTASFENIRTDGVTEVYQKILFHPHWVNRTLSYHCAESDITIPILNCVAVLEGGGHLLLDWFSSYRRIDFEIYSGCGLLWKRDNSQVRDVTDLVRMLTALVYDVTATHEGEAVVAQVDDLLMNHVRFSHQLRMYEFRKFDSTKWDNNALHSDLGYFYLSSEQVHKNQVASVQTDFQTVHIYDIKGFQSDQTEQLNTNRIVFLDGVIQSTASGDSPYHEALVQPGMFASKDPKRVAIIGGGEGATLREVLKHDSVQQVYMIEIDPIMVQTCREHLPQWNTCHHIEGSTHSCFDDPRAIIYYEDAMAWFINRFSGNSTDTTGGQTCVPAEIEDDDEDDDENDDDDDDNEEELVCVAKTNDLERVEKFDVIIMDALDPQDNVGFADILYNSDIFFSSLYNALTDDGVLIMQLGIANYLLDPPNELTEAKNKANIVNKLSQVIGFQSVHEYEESHCGFLDTWTFMVACKDAKACHKQWYSNAAYKELEIRRRLRKPSDDSKKSLLNYVDGVILEGYQVPSVANEVVYCRSPNAPLDCWVGHGYHQYSSVTDSDTRVVDSSMIQLDRDDQVLRAKVDIRKGDYITAGGTTLQIERSTIDLLLNTTDLQSTEAFGPFLKAIAASDTSKYTGIVPAGLTTMLFLTTGAQGDTPANVASLKSYIAEEISLCEGKRGKCHLETTHNVVVDRHLSTYGGGALLALRDISAGEVLVLHP